MNLSSHMTNYFITYYLFHHYILVNITWYKNVMHALNDTIRKKKTLSVTDESYVDETRVWRFKFYPAIVCFTV